MLGHGTNTKSNYGWKSDSDGTPELFYWQGAVEHWRPYYRYQYANDVWTSEFYWSKTRAWTSYNDSHGHDDTTDKENKLYTITFNHAERTVGRTLVWDGFADGLGGPGTLHSRFGNLTFISKDVFLIPEEVYPETPGSWIGTPWNPPIGTPDTYPRVILHANKITDDGAGNYTVTKKIWSRLILKEGATDTNNNPDAARMQYPGRVIGLSFIPPESPDYDEEGGGGGPQALKNIIVMTTSYPNGGFWTPDGQTNQNQDVRRMILKLDSDNAEISIPDYLTSTEGWTGPASEGGADGSATGVSAWKTIKDFGANSAGGYDADEGWCTLDSTGNMLYGNVMGYRDLSTVMSSYGHISETEGGPGYRITMPENDIVGDLGANWKLYMHDVGHISAPLGSCVDINPDTNSGNHVACYFDAGYTYDFQNGLVSNGYGYPEADSGSVHISGHVLGSGEIFGSWNTDNASEYANVDWSQSGNHHYNINGALQANAGCCDIYGQTWWADNLRGVGLPHKNTVLAFNPRNHTRWLLTGSGFAKNTTYNREGITVFRKEENTNKLVLLNPEEFTGDNHYKFKDHNGFRCVNYQFDYSWGAKYTVPCCLQDDLTCDDLAGGCTNGPTFEFDGENSDYTWSYHDWDDWKTLVSGATFDNQYASNVDEQSGLNGEIPTIAAPGRSWTYQPFFYAESGGMSFRPNWKL